MAEYGADEEPTIHLLSRDDLEETVRSRTEYLENLMDTMVDILLHLDPDGRIENANRACETILGFEPETVEGKPIDYLFASDVDQSSLTSMLSSAEFVERLLRTGHLTDVEVIFQTVEGSPVPMSLSASTMTREDGSISGIVCVAKDISERKEAEETAEFLHSLLRHDLGNKLQLTYGGLERAQHEIDNEAEIHSYIEMAMAGTEEAMELIENIGTLAKLGGEEESQPVVLTNELQWCVEQYEDHAAERGLSLELEVERDVKVLGGTLLSELFSNLLDNAIEHSGGSHVRVRTMERDGAVVVSVEDDGTGIDEPEPHRILERGVKGAGSSGSGLGTYLARRIAESYGGSIDVATSELGGARFDVTLQRAN